MKDFFDTWKFKILVAVAVFLVGIMAYAGANGRLTAAPQELLGVILTPFQKAGAVVSGGVGAMWEKYASIDKVMEQNEQLTAENAELRQQMVDYDRIKAENEAYKALANIQEKNSNATYVSGFVIGRDPLDEFGGFTLDKGTADGVAVNDAVISDRGYLLGVGLAVAVRFGLKAVLARDGQAKGARAFAIDFLTGLVFLAVAYVCGWAQLMAVASMTPAAAFAAGVAPFILVDLAKLVAAVICARAVNAAVGRRA